MTVRTGSLRGALCILFLSLAVLGIYTPSAQAQVLYGSVVGTVEDASGAVVPKASVTITNAATGVTREVTADDAGRYTAPNLLAGSYSVKVSASGFRPAVTNNVEVTINTVTRVDVKLDVGGTTEQVSVSAQMVSLQTDKSDVRHEITSTAMEQLPLPAYRNYQSLINLVPGATPAEYQNAVVDTPGRSMRTYVNGTNPNNNNTLVDGAANTFIWLPHHTYYVQPVESIETVNISTGSFDAEQGMAGGAAITVATKSGTNEIHGSAFWYHNNQHLNSAGTYFRGSSYVKPLTILNQPGFTVGGPIKKDKLFYFFSYERTAERTGYQGNYSTPPADFRAGDFSAWQAYSKVYDPATAINGDEKTRQQFPNNIIPKNRISPIFDAIQQLAPLPNQKSPTDVNNLQGTFNVAGVMKLDRHMTDLKVNYNATTKLAVWGKWSRMSAPVAGKYPFGDKLGGDALGTAGIGDTKVNIPTVGFTYTISPKFLVDGVFGYTRFDQNVGIPGQDQNVGLDVWKIPGTNGGTQYAKDNRYGGLPRLDGFGFSPWGIGDTWTPLVRAERTYEYRTNFSYIKGAHELRWGFEPRRLQLSHWQPEAQNPRGYIGFSGNNTVLPGQTSREPNQYAAALLGLVNNYNKSIQYFVMEDREWQMGWYFQDRFQASRKLTVNLGLRYEYYPLINRGDRGIERWDPYTNKVYLGGLGNTDMNTGVNGQGAITVSKKLFAPRLGFAYRASENTVVRAGYGITYDPLPFSRPLRGLYPATLSASWGPGSSGTTYAGKDTNYGWFNRLDQGIPAVPTPDVSKGVLDLPLNLDMGLMSPWGGQLHRGYIQSWNFTVERKLPLDMVANVAYVGTKTIHQMIYRNINTDAPGEDINTNNRFLAKLYGQPKTNAMYMWDGMGYSSYNALQASLNKNFTKGLYLKTAFTWSKALNMADEDGWTGLWGWNWEPMIPRNYGPAGYDRPKMFTTAWVYELPIGAGKKVDAGKVANLFVGGWKINGMFSAYSGTPFYTSGSSSSLRCQGCTQTADLVAPVKKIDTERGPGKLYFDPSSWQDPVTIFNKRVKVNGASDKSIYRSGSTGKNYLRGPGWWRIDPAIYKEFKITERIKSELRAESFNMTNTPRWGNPNAGSATPTRDADGNITSLNNYMSITSATAGDRHFRFALRIQF